MEKKFGERLLEYGKWLCRLLKNKGQNFGRLEKT